MIIRVLTEGQYRLDGNALAELDAMDDSLLDAVGAGDEQQFAERLRQVVELVQTRGKRIPDDELVESDLVIPAPDTTLEESRELFAGYPRNLR
jgi:hypothetical protein